MLSVSICDIGLLDGSINESGHWEGSNPTLTVLLEDSESSDLLRLEIDHDGDGVPETTINQSGSSPQFFYDPRTIDPSMFGTIELSLRAAAIDPDDGTILDVSEWQSFHAMFR